VNSVSITQNFTYACWLLCEFNDQCLKIILDDVPNFLSDSILLCNFLQGEVSQEGKYRVVAELTVLFSPVTECFSVCLYKSSSYLNLNSLSQFDYITSMSLPSSNKALTFWYLAQILCWNVATCISLKLSIIITWFDALFRLQIFCYLAKTLFWYIFPRFPTWLHIPSVRLFVSCRLHTFSYL
jgi:hypothetical protein